MKIASAIDSIVAALSPEKAYKRELYRQQLARQKKRSETYAAAKTNRLTGGWSPINSSVNPIIAASSPTVRARVRQLVRDFPVLSNAVDRLVDYTVGPGITFQSKVLGGNGKLDRKTITAIEDSMKYWMDEADVANKLHYYEMMALSKRQDVEPGEFVLIKRWRPNENRYIPYCLQMYEADWLTTNKDTNTFGGTQQPTTGIVIYQGIEYDASTGRVIAYHFEDPDSWGKSIRVKAEEVIHGFQTLRPGQLRGISPFAPGVLLAHDLQEYMDTEIDGAKLAAKWLAFVESPTPAARQLGLSIETNADGNQEYIDELENGIIEYLNPGEKINLASSNRPGGNFVPMIRLMMTLFSTTTAVPYEMLTGDYSGFNYTSLRVGRNDFLSRLRPMWTRHIRQFCRPTIEPAIGYAVMAGKLSLPGYFSDPKRYHRAEWQPPGMDAVDPLREAKAFEAGINARTKSPQQIIRARGGDPEEVLLDIQQWQEWLEEYGIDTPEKNSKALANSPSAIDGQKAAKILNLRG